MANGGGGAMLQHLLEKTRSVANAWRRERLFNRRAKQGHAQVRYRDIPFADVSVIKHVWERNRAFHAGVSQFFGDLYSELVFEDRIQGFAVFDSERIKITVAEAIHGGQVVGCCISTYEGAFGEPHTLHVLEEARGRGIGKELMRRHVAWLKASGCKAITVTVACENSQSIAFYDSLGFKPNTLQMRLK